MVEKTKASQGASVSKTANMNAQPSLQSKTQWDQKGKWDQKGTSGAIAADLCRDNFADAESPAHAASSLHSKKPAAKLEIGEQIGRQLRSVYNDVLAQPVPDRFLDLLRALEKDPK